MINYIELNGTRSTDVKGLMIQSLPPITKPKMRYSSEEIDGRDGDIVTKLGYSAYDKTVKIGLHSGYDIDDAISFFDSDGEVVFSNERDKYYRYSILEQIDFERLLKFRTADVKFHVQPFKYDAVDRTLDVINQLLHVKPYSAQKFGVSVEASESGIKLAGKATNTAEFYVPVEPLALKAGSYTLSAATDGTADGAAVRLIADSPSDYNSFGRTYVSLMDNATAVAKSSETGALMYTYIWMYVPAGTVLDCTLTVGVGSDEFDSVDVINRGNTLSRPRITVHGSGPVDLSINGTRILTLNIDDCITIDAEEMNAFRDGVLMNRHVKGDYANMAFRRGTNALSWVGNVTEIDIEDFSRWL